VVQETINNFIDKISSSAFDLASAGVIFFFGWYFSYVIGKKAADFMAKSRLNQVIKRLKWDEPIGRFSGGVAIAKIFGKTTEIWVLLFFLMVSAGILRLDAVSQFLNAAVVFFFYIFIVFLIFSAVALLADFSRRFKK
jgi:hypothetical protein